MLLTRQGYGRAAPSQLDDRREVDLDGAGDGGPQHALVLRDRQVDALLLVPVELVDGRQIVDTALDPPVVGDAGLGVLPPWSVRPRWSA
ncbi:hypothetical protein [Kitasatospora sp. NPDC008115]|uniref:hypothetical protein n=1 Tax=Kitasatospora sp. NPDC008115 TaxID=3364022 RepID=UPI0036E6E8B9